MSMERMTLLSDDDIQAVFNLKSEINDLQILIDEFLEYAQKHARQVNGLALNHFDIKRVGNYVSHVHSAIARCEDELAGPWSKQKLNFTSIEDSIDSLKERQRLIYRKDAVTKALKKLNKDIAIVINYFNDPNQATYYTDKIKGMMNSAIGEFNKKYEQVSANLKQRINAAEERQHRKSSVRKNLERCFLM